MKKTESSAITNFIIGAGSVFSIYPVNARPAGKTLAYNNSQGFQSDWKAIGKDFNTAVKKVVK